MYTTAAGLASNNNASPAHPSGRPRGSGRCDTRRWFLRNRHGASVCTSRPIRTISSWPPLCVGISGSCRPNKPVVPWWRIAEDNPPCLVFAGGACKQSPRSETALANPCRPGIRPWCVHGATHRIPFLEFAASARITAEVERRTTSSRRMGVMRSSCRSSGPTGANTAGSLLVGRRARAWVSS